ncbi:MAG: metal ABC transporter permease [Chitinispirillia bacterium]|nr:metal ABC transporter permease [Chitinispirillia bacterium]
MIDIWASLCGLLPFEWAQYSFMQNALLAVFLLAPLFALPGCLVINNRMAFFSDAMGHAALTGVAIGALLGIAQPLPSMLVFALLLACVISFLRRVGSVPADTVISLVMTGSMALGIVILSRQGGFARYSRYLIGDLLSINATDLLMIGATLLSVLTIWAFLFNRLYLISFNEPIARSRGINTKRYDMFFSMTVAFIVTIAVQWIGILVISSLLILPAAAARNFASSIRRYVLCAVAVSLVSCLCGLILSYYMATVAGATIVLVALGVYIVSIIPRLWRRQR